MPKKTATTKTVVSPFAPGAVIPVILRKQEPKPEEPSPVKKPEPSGFKPEPNKQYPPFMPTPR